MWMSKRHRHIGIQTQLKRKDGSVVFEFLITPIRNKELFFGVENFLQDPAVDAWVDAWLDCKKDVECEVAVLESGFKSENPDVRAVAQTVLSGLKQLSVMGFLQKPEFATLEDFLEKL